MVARLNRPLHDSGGFSTGCASDPARASTTPSRSMTQMRAVVRESPSMICAISGDADGGSVTPLAPCSLARSRANDAIGSGGLANSRGRSCSAVATACAVPASVRSCASRSTRSSSRTYSYPSHGSARKTVRTSRSCARIDRPRRTYSPQRYPMPYTVAMRSNAGSTARNLRRMRLTCDVIVLSSTTMLASRISASRSLTCPGCRASACTIQNSVSVRSTRWPFQSAVRRLTSTRSGPRSRMSSVEGGAASSSLRRNSAAMRAARCGRLASFVR